MPRATTATITGVIFVFFYIVAIVTIPDIFGRMHWAFEAAYWTIAGLLWVVPIRWLMLWSAGKH